MKFIRFCRGRSLVADGVFVASSAEAHQPSPLLMCPVRIPAKESKRLVNRSSGEGWRRWIFERCRKPNRSIGAS